MSFLNPLLLWGALAAGIPLVIHLWGRRRPHRVLFPSLRLIRAGQQQQRSLSRLRDLLILILRTLLILLVSLALAGPVAESRLLASLAPGDQVVAVVVDTSASMGYRHGGRTSLERAQEATRMILQALPRGARVRVFSTGEALAPVAPDGATLGGATLDGATLARLQAGFGQPGILDLLSRATQPEFSAPNARLFLITDLQATDLWGELARPLPTPPVVVDVGADRPVNHALLNVALRSACPLRSRPLEVEATVAAWGERGARELELGAEAEGRSLPGRTVALTPAAGGAEPARQHVPLRLPAPGSGDVRLKLTLPPDDLPADDVFYAVVPVRDRLRVRIISGGSDPRFLALALNPGGTADTGIEVTARHWEGEAAAGRGAAASFGAARNGRAALSGAPPNRAAASFGADLLVLADAPGDAPELRQAVEFARQGGGVVLFTGPEARLPDGVLRALLGAEVRLGGVVAAPAEEPLELAEVNTWRPPLDPFASPRAGDLYELRFTHRRELLGGEAARVLARFSDATPAILGTRDPDRHVLLLNTTLDDRWTNAPYRPVYVPLMHRLCYDAVGPLPRVWLDWFAGRAMHVEMPATAAGPAALRLPRGGTVLVSQNGTPRRWDFTPPEPGFYEATWQEGPRRRSERFAVNVPPGESDLRKLPAAELKRRLKAPGAAVLREDQLAAYLQRTALARVNLATPLLALAFVVFLAETLLSLPRRVSGGTPDLRNA